jgi:urease subunit alpha
VRAERGGVELAITGGLLFDPVLGIRETSIGIANGRVTAIGRAGNPDTMDGVEVVLDTATAVIDATGFIVTPGGIDTHVHWLSPQVCDAALAGGLTTLVIQDFGPVWNLGTNPPEGVQATWAALEAHAVNAALLVRASSSRPEPVEHALRAGGAGLKIHEDVSAGPEQIRTALDIADRHDVQLAIHTDGLNEALSVEDTYAAFGGRTVHAFHIEGCGGGHAPDLLNLAGRERILTSSTSPTVPFGVHAEAEHLAMVPAVHVVAPGGVSGDWTALRARVRPRTMAAEGVLHDLGVIAMLSSDSQGMGRIGEVVRRAFQNAAWMRQVRGPEPGPGDNERALRHLAKVTINPAIAHGLAAHVGSLQPGRLADAVLWRPELFAVRPEIVLKSGIAAWGASGDPNATTMLAEPVLVRRQIGAEGAAAARLSAAFLAREAMDAELPTTRPRLPVEGCREVTAADMVRNDRTGEVRVDPRTHEVTLDGEPVDAPPLEEVQLSARYLLG